MLTSRIRRCSRCHQYGWIRDTADSSGFGGYAQMQVRAEGCGSGAEDEAGY